MSDLHVIASPVTAVVRRGRAGSRTEAGPRKVEPTPHEDAMHEVEHAARAIYVELATSLSSAEEAQPELAVWVTTAIWLLETQSRRLARERDGEVLARGIGDATMHAMRISCGIELMDAMGLLHADPERFDQRIGGILTRLRSVACAR